MRILFLGTPEFAVPTLERLINWPNCQVVGLVTQPDRPAGRGKNIFPPPTKLIAQAHGIPVLQPVRLSKSPETVQAMRDLSPDVLVTAAFGQILKPEVLEMAPMGVVNLHGSLLPKYRGAAPINWSIIEGETVGGLTTMISDVGVDTGPMLLKREVPIEPNMNAEEYANILAVVGADLMVQTLDALANKRITPEPQNNELATMAPRLTKEHGKIDWRKTAQQIHNQVRGLYPWPGTFTEFNGAPLKIITTRVPEAPPKDGNSAEPGTIISIGETIYLTCGPDGQDLLELVEVQPPNKARMKARDWANGARLQPGVLLGASG